MAQTAVSRPAALKRGATKLRASRCAWAVACAMVLGVFAAGVQRVDAKEQARNAQADGSELSIVAADVQLLLIAPDGKETGYDPRAKKQVREIAGATYFEDALAEFDSGRVDRSTTQTLQVRRPRAGKYRLVVSPGYLEDGERYEVRVKLYRKDSSEAADGRIEGTVKGREAEVYELELGGRRGSALVVNRAARTGRLGNVR